jgi:hypothetical protein
MQIQMVIFSEPKLGYEDAEWQDSACGGVISDPSRPVSKARFIVMDGAATAYDPVRWVDQLVTSFIPGPGAPAGPRLEQAAMRTWFAEMQDRWTGARPVFDNVIEERMWNETGSFATLLGFEISGLDGPEPSWQAVALGDTVLFHVRANRLVTEFPPLGPDEFGTRPDGVHTLRKSLDRMTERLEFNGGVLEVGDYVFAATDAMAHWIVRAIKREGQAKVWTTLAGLAHPDVFSRFVADQRKEIDAAKRLKNDDVTLMRMRITANQPSFLLACR